MSEITIKNVTFSYDGFDNIFENVNLTINSMWKLGLVGRNGKGKTTLFKLLNGELEHSGTISSLLNFEVFPFNLKTEDQNIFETIENVDSSIELWKVMRELSQMNFENVDFSRAFSSFSGGEQTKIMLGVLFAKDNGFLLIDEPTNHLDSIGRSVLSSYLSKKSSYIIISHDRDFLDGCVDHILSINKKTLELEKGNFTSYLENKEKREAFEFSENEKLKSDIKHLELAKKRTQGWADKSEASKIGRSANAGESVKGLRPYIGSKTKKMMKQAKAIEKRQDKAIMEKSKLLKDVERADAVFIKPLTLKKERLVTVKDFVMSYGTRKLNSPLTFDIENGDVISLVGANGSGKTSLIKTLLSLANKSKDPFSEKPNFTQNFLKNPQIPTETTETSSLKKNDSLCHLQITKSPNDNFSYQGTFELCAKFTVSFVPQTFEEVRGTFEDFCETNSLDKTQLLTFLYRLGIERKEFEKPLDDFSQGSKKKVLIARSLLKPAHLYIWDEPLNYLDIIAREQIKTIIKEGNLTMLVVEHDKSVRDEVATKIVKMEQC